MKKQEKPKPGQTKTTKKPTGIDVPSKTSAPQTDGPCGVDHPFPIDGMPFVIIRHPVLTHNSIRGKLPGRIACGGHALLTDRADRPPQNIASDMINHEPTGDARRVALVATERPAATGDERRFSHARHILLHPG